MKTLGFATALMGLWISVSGNFVYGADVGCLDTDPLPAAPSAGAEQASFTASFFTSWNARINFWRLNCAPAGSRIAVRVTPTAGTPSISGFDFYVIQDGRQFGNLRLVQSDGRTFSGSLFLPMTFLLGQLSSDPPFNRELAFRLIYNGPQATFGDLPAAGPAAPADISPLVGLWWNPNESGSGYAIDVKHGVMVMTIYSYNANGDPEWYYVAGPLTNGGRNFTSTLDRYRSGQCISCPYTGRPTAAGSAGTISVSFSSATAGTITLPGGRVTNIQPQPF